MKNLKQISLVTLGTALLSSSVLCQVAVRKPEVKFDLSIRFVDSIDVLGKSDSGKDVKTQLDQKQRDLAQRIKQKENQLTTAAKEFQAKAPTLSESGKVDEQKKIVRMEREYKTQLQEAEEDMKITMQSRQRQLLEELNIAVKEYAEENKIDLVFGPGGVVHASEKASCTMEVIEKMNKNRSVKLAKGKGTTVVASKDQTKKTT